jgi:hypothetical protein
MLLIVFVVLWKPLALALIYLELQVHILLHLVRFVLGLPLWWSTNDHLDKAWDCLGCIFSLSLALRFFTSRPSSVELRKHDRLQKRSILYRVFRHII